MALNLSNLKPGSGSQKTKKRVGRGGKRGTYSGRGQKGQKSRSGGKGGLKTLGFKSTLQRIPQKRGFKSLQTKMEVVNLADLNRIFKDGDTIELEALLKNNLIDKIKNGVKILGRGVLNKKLIVRAHQFSKSAQEAIEKAGGKAEIIGGKE
ncbi:MAG: 50S ribosomal protein L15 [Patescibacteria group bacterium]|nr:50S ribosomal protein L15 [Patescibacteria group bacterium]